MIIDSLFLSRLLSARDPYGNGHSLVGALWREPDGTGAHRVGGCCGGGVRAGLLGEPADLGKVTRGGLDAAVDFRDIYADGLRGWLGVDPAPILGSAVGSSPS